MAGKSGKNWVLVLLILCGIVLGSFLGYLAKDVSWLSWLNYGKEFGIGTTSGSGALVLNLGAMVITFGLTIRITIASIIGVLIAVIVHKKL